MSLILLLNEIVYFIAVDKNRTIGGQTVINEYINFSTRRLPIATFESNSSWLVLETHPNLELRRILDRISKKPKNSRVAIRIA